MNMDGKDRTTKGIVQSKTCRRRLFYKIDIHNRYANKNVMFDSAGKLQRYWAAWRIARNIEVLEFGPLR
jgi:hypothetical protein